MKDVIYMGNTVTRGRSASKIKIPSDHSLIKIASVNVDLYNFITAKERIALIVRYIFKSKCDVICLQGISDLNIGIALVKQIKKTSIKKGPKIYFSPLFDDINISTEQEISSKKMFDISWGAKQSKNLCNKLFVKNIIVSKYPINDIIFTELDKETDIDDLLGAQTLVGAVITVNGSNLPIFCASLSKDIKTTDIINNDVRRTEMNEICACIKSRKYKYNIIAGSFNINEIINNEPNQEFIEMIKTHKLIDIYRYKNDNENGFTTNHMERLQYIFILLKKNKQYDNINELTNYVYKKYGMYFIECSVNTDIILGKNYPIECTFMIKKNEK